MYNGPCLVVIILCELPTYLHDECKYVNQLFFRHIVQVHWENEVEKDCFNRVLTWCLQAQLYQNYY